MSNSICAFPWTHLFVDTMGNFYNCCIGPSADHVSRNEDGSPIRASEKGAILKHWHSLYMTSIRKSMMMGDRHDACDPCWRVENVGGKSYRHASLETYKLPTDVTSKILPAPDFQFIDLRFGNICNLACRMCLPYSSRKMVPEYIEMYGEEHVKPYLKLDWFESEDFWEELFSYSKNLKKIHLAGGEPLLIKQCWKFLKRLVDEGISKNLVLSYNTNITILPPEAKEIWPHFKEVHLIASMDGVKEVNEFIRYPLNWETYEQNIKELDENAAAYNIGHLQIHATAQVYNIKRIGELCDYVATAFKNIKRVPRFDIVYGPEEFDPQVLPAFYREEAALLIDQYIVDLENGRNNLSKEDKVELIQNIKSIANHLRSGDKNHLFHQFKRINDVYDRHRNHRTFDFIPELEKAY